MALLDRLEAPGPKRILSLDGGGIRGALSLGILEKIEATLRERHNKPDLLLCDYFDLIGGTSTGSIIATLLALGYPVSTIKDMYMELGGLIFGDRNFLSSLIAKYDEKPLIDNLKKILGADTTLGSDKLKTGLCVVAKRADTYSTWPFINHPKGKYYEHNKNLPLWQVVRSSTAAPTVFKAQKMDLGDQIAAFVDGGISSYNNPALLFFIMATADGFPFHWQPGADNICIVSVGTGTFHKSKNPDKVFSANMLGWAGELPDYFMDDSTYNNQMILQYMAESPTAFDIDSEIGKVNNNLFTEKNKALYYLRYNAWLEYRKRDNDGKPVDDIPNLEPFFSADHLAHMRDMTRSEFRKDLYFVGQKTADFYVKHEHFKEIFNVQ